MAYQNNEQLAIHDVPNPSNIPKEDLEESVKERKETDDDCTVLDFREWACLMLRMIDSENHEEEMRRIRKITKLMRYYRGEQRGFWSASTGEWVTINPDDFEPRDAALLVVNNQIRPMVKNLQKEWSRSRSRIRVNPRDDTVQKKGAARYATAAISSKQDSLMPESFRQVEGKSAFLAGNYVRYSCYDKSAKGGVAHIPRTEKVTKKEYDDFFWCPDCDREMDKPKADGSCYYCGSKDIQEEKGEENTYSKMSSIDKVKVGCPITRFVDCREIKVHIRARCLAETPYLRWRQYVLCSTLKEQYRWASIKPTTAGPITRYIQETEMSSGISGLAKTTLMNFEEYGIGLGGMTEFARIWLRPSLYFNLKAEKDITLGDNEVIKEGEKFIDRYPEGMYIAYSGPDELLDVQDEIIDDYWAHGTYDKLIESFWGDGLDDLIPMQELVNETQSLFVENLIYNASPKIIYNPFLIEASMLSNNPAEMVPMTRQSKRDDNPGNAVYQMKGMSIAADVPAAMETAIETMRDQSGSHLAMSGSNDPKLNTATAMAIARDASVAQLGPPLALKSEVDVQWAYQILKMLQKYWVDGVSDKILGQYTVQEAKWFKECDIETDLEITIEAGSWTPRTELEVRNDFLSFVTAGGIPLGFANPQVPYEIKQKAAELFRMPIDLDKLQPDIRNAHLRIEQLQAAAGVMLDAGVIDETTDDPRIIQLLTMDVPVDQYIDDHGVIKNTYVSWLKTDEGRFAPASVVESVHLLIQKHDEAIRKLQDEGFQEEAKYQMAAQAMSGMMQQQQNAAETENQAKADIAKKAAEQKGEVAQQVATEPLPVGDQRTRPTTPGAQGRPQAAPTA